MLDRELAAERQKFRDLDKILKAEQRRASLLQQQSKIMAFLSPSPYFKNQYWRLQSDATPRPLHRYLSLIATSNENRSIQTESKISSIVAAHVIAHDARWFRTSYTDFAATRASARRHERGVGQDFAPPCWGRSLGGRLPRSAP